jgi:hypothetical protein
MLENVHLLCQMESTLQRTIKRTHIIFKKFIEKNIDDKNILATLKKRL